MLPFLLPVIFLIPQRQQQFSGQRSGNLFDSCQQDIFLIPGNHDAPAFKSGEYYGRNVHTCSETPVRWELQGIPLIGIPYLPGRQGVDLLHTHVQGESSPCIVIMHTNFYNSSLSALYFSSDEDDSRSSCLWEHDLASLPEAYIALGHWHNPTLPPVKINNVQVGIQWHTLSHSKR